MTTTINGSSVHGCNNTPPQCESGRNHDVLTIATEYLSDSSARTDGMQ